MSLILPNSYKKEKVKLFIAQMFILNDANQIVAGSVYPAPTNGIYNGAFLSQIHANLASPIDSMLQTALQNDEVKVLFRVTELKKFLAEKQRVETLQNLRATGEPQKEKANDNEQPASD